MKISKHIHKGVKQKHKSMKLQKISDDEISALASKNFDLRPTSIINQFDLRGLPAKNGGKFYQLLASYGHMGRTDIDVLGKD